MEDDTPYFDEDEEEVLLEQEEPEYTDPACPSPSADVPVPIFDEDYDPDTARVVKPKLTWKDYTKAKGLVLYGFDYLQKDVKVSDNFEELLNEQYPNGEFDLIVEDWSKLTCQKLTKVSQLHEIISWSRLHDSQYDLASSECKPFPQELKMPPIQEDEDVFWEMAPLIRNYHLEKFREQEVHADSLIIFANLWNGFCGEDLTQDDKKNLCWKYIRKRTLSYLTALRKFQKRVDDILSDARFVGDPDLPDED